MLTELTQGFRLSLQQEHLWLLAQDAAKNVYRTKGTILIEGNLNLELFTTVLKNIVARYEILRTNFQYLPGMNIPVQVILDEIKILEHNYDLSELASGEQEQLIAEIFNSPCESLFDTSLITLSPIRHILFVNMSAMLGDFESLQILIREFSLAYATGFKAESLVEETLQYADFAEWQNEILQAEENEIGKEYWRKQNFSSLKQLKLAGQSKLAKSEQFCPQVFREKLPPDIFRKIEAISQKYQISVATFLLTCWKILLWHLTRESEIIVGVACQGREYPELEETLGLFTKFLPTSNHFSEDASVSQLLQNVEKSTLEASQWQEYFSGKNVSELDNKLHFCPFCFEFKTQTIKSLEGELNFSLTRHFTCIDKFIVKLACYYQNNFLITDFYYDLNQFEAQQIITLQEQFQQLVISVVQNPEAKISALKILSDRDLTRLLVEFNQTKADYPQNQCIHHLFEAQVKLTPNNIAVVFKEEQLTYNELNIRANQLAHYLQRLGIKPGDNVGICVERSLLMIVGILGILKAGAAYIPLDPNYPSERLALIVEDIPMPVLLTQQRIRESSTINHPQTVCLDTALATIALESEANPNYQIWSDNLAYIIHTSGSTGKPKGVQITHQNLVHSTLARINYYQIPPECFLLLSSFAFDSSVAGIFWTLSLGGKLYLPEEGSQRDVVQIIESISQQQVSHLLCLPSLYALVLEQANPEQLKDLRGVIVAGETCSVDLVQRHLELLKSTSLFNEYGPTEATVWSTVYDCCDKYLEMPIPIGRPIANTQTYILDSHCHPVPLNVVGELYISGDGIARGYLNQPDLTAQKFIPNPFSDKLGTRLYKTGDLARYLPDGKIEFLGRVDNQVKIRGYRIELGEVENALNQHPAVSSLAIIARQNESGHNRLLAYLVPNPERSPSSEELRNFLQDKLPEYMIPSAFIKLKTLPLLPNGKLDIKALPASEITREELSENFVAPRTPIEKILAETWTQVLKVKQVGVHDNFFELGGDSITAIQATARVNQMGWQLTPRDLFAHKTIAELATVVVCDQDAPQKQSLAEPGLARFKEELDYWLSKPRQQIQPIPVDFVEDDRVTAKTSTRSMVLSLAETQVFLDVPKNNQSQVINDVVLTALVKTLVDWTGSNKLLVDLENVQSEPIFNEIDLSSTVVTGRTSPALRGQGQPLTFPMLFELEHSRDREPDKELKTLKEQLRRVPNRGVGYGVLRYQIDDSEIVEKLLTMPQAELKFNLFNQDDRNLERENKNYLLEVDWWIDQNQLQIDWTYKHSIYRQETIENLMANCLRILRSLIVYCQTNNAQIYTPSDFPQAHIGQQDLDKLLAKINQKTE
jgi:amino acid adenylation domain-containing protein/non-ribosomal peptide synthase protein (TIGR01720 family)